METNNRQVITRKVIKAKSSGNVARGVARADYFLSKYGDKMFDYDFFHKNR